MSRTIGSFPSPLQASRPVDERGDRPGQTNPLTAALKGILFDFDGTPADTMAGIPAWKSALGEYGIPIEADDYYPLEGLGP